MSRLITNILQFLLGLLERWFKKPEAVPTPAPAPVPTPAPVPPSQSWLPELLRGQQELRQRQNKGVLNLHELLCQAAQEQAEWQAQENRLTHIGKQGTTVHGRLRQRGYHTSAAGENVAYGYPDAAAALAGWASSRAHLYNLLGNWVDAGFGRAQDSRGRYYWVAVYANGQDSAQNSGVALAFPPGLRNPDLTDEFETLPA